MMFENWLQYLTKKFSGYLYKQIKRHRKTKRKKHIQTQMHTKNKLKNKKLQINI